MISRFLAVAMLVLVGLAAALSAGCNDPEIISSGGAADVYFGRFEADEVGVSDFPNIDSVQVLIRGTSYTIINYPIPNEDPTVDFCNSGGHISGFGTSKVTFSPQDTVGVGCDRGHIPQGQMNAYYPGDSIIIADTVEITFIRQRDQGIIDTVTSAWGLTLWLVQ